MNCKVCGSEDIQLFARNKKREFLRCSRCELVFVPEQFYLTTEQERTRYDLHDNSIDNKGYIEFLEKIVSVIADRFPVDCTILDFGSGANAVLGKILDKKGYSCDSYDPLFNIQRSSDFVLYDIIVICEVIEHLRFLQNDLEFIKKHLKPDGTIIIRTQLYPDAKKFLNWWYIQDLTHINFFSPVTIAFVASQLNRAVVLTREKDIFILEKTV
jgi:SAM-dependent methyltransferase